MFHKEEDLRRLLRECTVRINTPSGHGTGFFAGQSLVLTCRHVVVNEQSTFTPEQLNVLWNGQSIQVEKVECVAQPGPDLALLSLAQRGEHPVPSNHPCPWLFSAIAPGDEVFSFGYPESFTRGGSATFDYEGEFVDESGRTGIKLKKGQADFGLSGSPVLNCRTRSVCAVMYYSDDPTSDLGARVIPIDEATGQWREILQQQEDAHKQDTRWISFLPIYRLQKQEVSIRERFFRGELLEHSSSIPSPLQSIWQDFIYSTPWHEWVASRCSDIADAAAHIEEGQQLIPLLGNIDEDETYDNIVSALRPLCSKYEFIQKWVDKYRDAWDSAFHELEKAKTEGLVTSSLNDHVKKAEEAFSRTRRIAKQVRQLKEEIEALRFSTCLLVSGTLGSGKTHFLSSLLTESIPDPYTHRVLVPINLLDYPAGSLEEAILREVSRSTDMRWQSFSELNHYLASLDRPCKLVIAVDGIARGALDYNRLVEFVQLIADSTALHQVRWLIEINLYDYARLTSQLKAWSEYGFRSRRSENAKPDDRMHANIAGWLTLDDLNRTQQLGIELIKAAIADKPASQPLLSSLPLVSPATLEHLVNPFVAWALIDVRELLPAKSLVSLNFIEFVTQFWKALVAKMAPFTDRPDLFEQCAALVASFYVSAVNHGTLGDLLNFFQANATQSPELRNPAVARTAVAGLERANLLEIRKSDADAFLNDDPKIALRFPVFWQWAIARRLLQEQDFVAHRAGDAVDYLQLWFDESPAADLNKEGILEFVLLLIDQWGTRSTRDIKFVAEVWHRALTESQLPKGALWFAAPKATLGTQTAIAGWASTLSASMAVEADQLFPFMYFCTEAQPEVLDVPGRFALLQPLYSKIKESLTKYFSYLTFRLFPKIESPEKWIKTMTFLAGCEVLGISEELADSAVDRLIEIEPSRQKLVDIILRYLATVQPPPYNPRERAPWKRTGFYEWIVYSFLRYVLEHAARGEPEDASYNGEPRTLDAQEAYELLTKAGWYRGNRVHKEVAFSIRREANIAMGYWYRTANDDKRDIYHSLVASLLSSHLKSDHETAFFLIRHTEPTARQIAVRVDPEFRPALEEIARDERLQFIREKYGEFFRCNKVAVPVSSRQNFPETGPDGRGHSTFRSKRKGQG
jgi:trypsin-like peptidase